MSAPDLCKGQTTAVHLINFITTKTPFSSQQRALSLSACTYPEKNPNEKHSTAA